MLEERGISKKLFMQNASASVTNCLVLYCTKLIYNSKHCSHTNLILVQLWDRMR